MTPAASRYILCAAVTAGLLTPLRIGAADAPACDGARPGAVLVVEPVTALEPIDPRPYPTFGFMFTGSDRHRYASTAGHVALELDNGERVWSNGDGAVVSDLDGNRVGAFVYAINTRAGSHPGLPPGADLALIRVDDDAATTASVCHFGGPREIDDRIAAPPEIVDHFWHGAGVIGGRIGHPAPVDQWVMPARSGVSLGMPSAYSVSVIGHSTFGDSGAPVLSGDGRAVGWISGPPSSGDELAHGGSFVVSRIGPAIARAEFVLGIELTLVKG